MSYFGERSEAAYGHDALLELSLLAQAVVEFLEEEREYLLAKCKQMLALASNANCDTK